MSNLYDQYHPEPDKNKSAYSNLEVGIFWFGIGIIVGGFLETVGKIVSKIMNF